MFRLISTSKLLFLLFLPAPSLASVSTPQLFTTHYDLSEAYGTYNHMITQDAQNIIYAANFDGVFKYAGNKWEYVNDSYNITPYAIQYDSNTDKVLVGGINDFGYIENNNKGEPIYYSIKHFLSKQPNTLSIGNIIIHDDAAYFIDSRNIFIWNRKNNIDIVTSDKDSYFGIAFIYQNKVIIEIRNKGLYTIDQQQLTPFFINPAFKNKFFQFALPGENNAIILGTDKNGLFIISNNKIQPFKTEVDDLLKFHYIAAGKRLSNGNLALAFRSYFDSMVIISITGKLLFHIDDEIFSQGMIHHLFEDKNHSLWVSSEQGVSKIELNSPIIFDRRNGVKGAIRDLIKEDHHLYLATDLGVLGLNTQSKNQQFSKLEADSYYCYSLLKTTYGILAACSGKILLINKGNAKIILLNNYDQYKIQPTTDDEKSFLMSHYFGLSIITPKNNTWQQFQIKEFINTPYIISTFIREKDNTYWFNLKRDGILRVIFEDNFQSTQKKVYHHATHPSLPKGYIAAKVIDNQLVFSTDLGLYELNENAQPAEFYPSNIFNRKFENTSASPKILSNDMIEIRQFAKTKNRPKNKRRQTNLFIGKKDATGQYQWSHDAAFARIHLKNNFRSIYDSPGIVWVQSEDALYKVNYISPELSKELKPPLIESINALKAKQKLPILQNSENEVELNFDNNSIQFNYVLPYFIDEKNTQYQTRLLGFSQDWSKWTLQKNREYLNLPEGTYIFKVRAKNIYDRISPVRTYTFIVLPPWYRSWYAYLSYILIFFIVLLFSVKTYTNNIRKKAQRLEETVSERTQQISTLLKQKDDMFANISHELRTPLTLMLGPTDLLLQDKGVNSKNHYLNLIKHNGTRLLRLIEQMLSMAKISTSPNIQYKQQAIKPVIDYVVNSFQTLAMAKNIHLSCNPYQDVCVSTQEDALEKILLNLVSNAIKYTPDGGEIVVDVGIHSDPRTLQIQVRDTGPGIPEDQQQAIFEKFHRLDNTDHDSTSGTGIGLSLVKDLVDAHGGQVNAANHGEHGAVFTVCLPVISSFNLEDCKSEAFFASNAVDLELNAMAKLSDTTIAATESTVKEDEPSEQEKTRLLIIEDTPDMRNFLVDIFSESYLCTLAKDGLEGIEKAKEQLPDLIISDVMMPGKNGYEVCHALKNDELTSHIPILILTAKADFESRMQGWGEKADEYLGKPFNAEELKLRVSNLISIRQTLKQRFSREFHSDNSLKNIHHELSKRDRLFIEKFNAMIEKNFANENFDLPTAAQTIAMSKRQLQLKLKALMDHTFRDYLRTYRLKKAREYLRQGERISDVINLTGFNSPSHFSRCYKAEYGHSPKTRL